MMTRFGSWLTESVPIVCARDLMLRFHWEKQCPENQSSDHNNSPMTSNNAYCGTTLLPSLETEPKSG